MDAIYEETYRGHSIKIVPDLSPDSPSEWNDDSFLVHYHRDCWIEDKRMLEDALRGWYNGEKIEQAREYHIFSVAAYIHSGVVLSLESTFPGDSYGWDTSHVGAVLVAKTDANNKKKARSVALGIVATWNAYLSGSVYGFVTDTDDGCCGFYDVETTGKKLHGTGRDYGGALMAARDAIDCYIEKKLAENRAKLRAYITNKVPLEKREPMMV